MSLRPVLSALSCGQNTLACRLRRRTSEISNLPHTTTASRPSSSQTRVLPTRTRAAVTRDNFTTAGRGIPNGSQISKDRSFVQTFVVRWAQIPCRVQLSSRHHNQIANSTPRSWCLVGTRRKGYWLCETRHYVSGRRHFLLRRSGWGTFPASPSFFARLLTPLADLRQKTFEARANPGPIGPRTMSNTHCWIRQTDGQASIDMSPETIQVRT